MRKEDTSYDDIIHLPHHQSQSHRHMTNSERAAQFSPFAALTGHEAAILETARQTERKIELDEYEKEIINNAIQKIVASENKDIQVTVTYFEPDSQKEGGAYRTITGSVKKIDEYALSLIFQDGVHIPIDNIVEIDLDSVYNFKI